MKHAAGMVDIDALTGLLSRRGFRDLLQAQQQGYAVLHADIEQFSLFNILLGSQRSDRILAVVAARMEAYAGVPGRCARLGSDEFAVLVTGIASDEHLEMSCLELMAELQQTLMVDAHTLHPLVTIGATRWQPGVDIPDPDQQLWQARVALQQAKTQDYPQYCIYNGVLRHIWENRAFLELQLIQSVHAGDFTAEHQPIVDVTSGNVEGFETLARWTLPDGRIVSPAQFIPIAERNGAIIALGKQIAHSAVRDFAKLAAMQPQLRLHLNVSARQLADPSLCAELVRLLELYELLPSQLVVELTESRVAEQFDRLITAISCIKAAGIGVALDDFGTGFSSLSYIAGLELDLIKIDRSFLVNAHQSEEALCIMRAILGMTRSLGIRTVAEGVEIPEHVALLKREGCDYLQGYLTGRPMKLAQCLRYLQERPAGKLIGGIKPTGACSDGGQDLTRCPMFCRHRAADS